MASKVSEIVQRARELLDAQNHDLLITSHEPGASLRAALRLRRSRDIPWLADLGDPVVTPITPRWRRRLDLRLERRALRAADRIVVTTDKTRGLLEERHGLDPGRLSIIPQGFDAVDAAREKAPGPGSLQLVFTGTLYAGLRNPAPLFEALRSNPDVKLTVAGAAVGFRLADLAPPPNVEFLGKLAHDAVLERQRGASVLVNIGNDNAEQVPGKLFEYFGAARPILHLRQHPDDPGANLLTNVRRGLVVENDAAAIGEALGRLCELHARGQLDAAFDLGEEPVAPYSWAAHGEALEALCLELAR